MSGNKVIKSVSLNKTVAEDQLILDRIKRRNFSGYVKKLILADIQVKREAKAENKSVEGVKMDVDNNGVKIYIPKNK